MKYKMIFSDMDGTLLKNENEISAEDRRAINEVVKRGVKFVICTGRGVFGIEDHLKTLGLWGKEGFAVCQNGGAVYNLKDMSLIKRESYKPMLLRSAVDLSRSLGLENFYYDDRVFIAEKKTRRVEKYCRVMKCLLHIEDDPLNYRGEFTKCLISGENRKLKQVEELVKSSMNDKLSCFYSADIFLEIVKKGVSKGNAMKQIAEKCGVKSDEIIAVGDSQNDISMIEAAGVGVAVKNAQEDVKKAADYVTEASNSENAMTEIIHRFIL